MLGGGKVGLNDTPEDIGSNIEHIDNNKKVVSSSSNKDTRDWDLYISSLNSNSAKKIYVQSGKVVELVECPDFLSFLSSIKGHSTKSIMSKIDGRIGRMLLYCDSYLIKAFYQFYQFYHVNQLYQLYQLTTKQLLLLIFLKPLTISEASNLMKIDTKTAYSLITRNQRGSGLLLEGLLEIYSTEKNVKKYIITNAGLDHLIYFYEQGKIKKEMQERLEWESINSKNILSKLEDFIELNIEKLNDSKEKGLNYVEYSFTDIMRYSVELADHLLNNPEECIKNLNFCIKEYSGSQFKGIKCSINKLPKVQQKDIGALRKKDLNKFITIIGSVVSVSEVKPRVTTSKFECPSCGNIINVIQEKKKFTEPSRCGCGRKGKFRLISKELIDIQWLKLEELGENLGTRTNQQKMRVLLKEDLTNIENQPFFENSTPIIVNGILKEVPVLLRSGSQSTTYVLMFEAVSIEFDEDIKQVKLDGGKIEECKQLASKPDLYKVLTDSFAKHIFNRDNEKLGLLLSIVSGGCGINDYRDDIHVLEVGDPGTSKSSLILEAFSVVVGSRWVSGKGTSSAGLVGTVTKDKDFDGEVVLQKGALAMANNNVCFCDELDKMHQDHTDSLHEALENQYCSIDKWNKHQRFKTDCTFIATANPKHGIFDKTTSFISQIKLPSALIDRFDIVMPFFDTVGKFDKDLAEKICSKFDGSLSLKNTIKSDLLKTYIYYARNNFNPKITKSASKELTKYFMALRTASLPENNNSGMYISARQMEGLLRLTRATAKLRLSNSANDKDAKIAITIYDYFIRQFGLNVEGIYDIETIGEDNKDTHLITTKDELIKFIEENDKVKGVATTTLIHNTPDSKETWLIDLLYKLKRDGILIEQFSDRWRILK